MIYIVYFIVALHLYHTHRYRISLTCECCCVQTFITAHKAKQLIFTTAGAPLLSGYETKPSNEKSRCVFLTCHQETNYASGVPIHEQRAVCAYHHQLRQRKGQRMLRHTIRHFVAFINTSVGVRVIEWSLISFSYIRAKCDGRRTVVKTTSGAWGDSFSQTSNLI